MMEMKKRGDKKRENDERHWDFATRRESNPFFAKNALGLLPIE